MFRNLHYINLVLFSSIRWQSLGRKTRNCKGRSYALFPVLFQKYFCEEKLIVVSGWSFQKEILTHCCFLPFTTTDRICVRQSCTYRSLPPATLLVETNMKQSERKLNALFSQIWAGLLSEYNYMVYTGIRIYRYMGNIVELNRKLDGIMGKLTALQEPNRDHFGQIE